MTREVYELMKARIKQVEDPVYYVVHPETPREYPLYQFCSDGLNEDKSDDFVFDIILASRTKNIWNVAQRFYSYYSSNCMRFENRLFAAHSLQRNNQKTKL